MELREDIHLTDDELCAASSDHAVQCLKENGVVVIRGALAGIAPLHGSMMAYLDRVDAIRRNGGDFSAMPARLHFNPGAYAADFVPLDPDTAGRDGAGFPETSLWQAALKGPAAPVLRQILSDRAGWHIARSRIVFHDSVHGLTRGNLSFHQEREVSKMPGLHNIWTAFLPAGATAGENAAGMQFYLGDRHRWSAEDVVALRTSHDQKRLFKPQMRTGDILIFDGLIPHASFMPPSPTAPRVAVDVRLFPVAADQAGIDRLW